MAIRKLLKAYRSACHWGDEDAQTPGEGGTEEENGGTVLGVGRYRIAGSEVFNKILVFCLREMDGLLRGLLWGSSGGSGGGEESLEKSEKWSKIGPLIKSYLGNSLHILGQMTEENLLCFSLRRLTASVGLLRPFPPLARKFLKVHSPSSVRGEEILSLYFPLLSRWRSSIGAQAREPSLWWLCSSSGPWPRSFRNLGPRTASGDSAGSTFSGRNSHLDHPQSATWHSSPPLLRSSWP